MRKRIAMVAFGAALIATPAAQAADIEAANAHWKPYEERYLRLYEDYVHEFGAQAAGRNIVDDGYRTHDGDVRVARKSEVTASSERFKVALHPDTTSTTATTTTAAPATYTATTSSSTVACESGGDYSANTGNGYYGGYQFDSGTWDAYGDPAYAEASDAPPSVQDAAAASVPYDAWPNC
jgi:hypothetical protein